MEFRVMAGRWESNGERGIWIVKEVKSLGEWVEWARISLTDEECQELGLSLSKNLAFPNHSPAYDEAVKELLEEPVRGGGQRSTRGGGGSDE